MVELKNIQSDMIANNLTPFEATHPGELIKEELEYRNISQKQLSIEMGVSYTVLNDIVNKKRPVNIKFALLCEAALNISASLLMKLQADYDFHSAKQNPSFMEKLQSIRRIAAAL